MKAFPCLLFLILMAFASTYVEAQVTNLIVNGSSTSFTMTSGGAVTWSYNVPVGATSNGELWYDVNGNGTIEPGTDIARFIFTQTDGDSNGNGGPPDFDHSANGSVSFSQPVGLAPGKYVFRMTQNSVGQTITGTVLTLSSPAHTISGTVTPPAGKSAQYIFVEAHRNDQYGYPNGWDAITDVSGNYTIRMNADTAGNPWRIRFADHYNPYPPNIVTPDEISLTISAPSYTGYNFSFIQAAAQVAGYVKDENNNPVTDRGAQLFSNNGGTNRSARTNNAGFFQIGLLSGDLTGQTWTLQTECNCNNGITGSDLIGQASLPVINSGDSLFRTLVIYTANSQIQGQVRVNGHSPSYPVQVMASNPDSVYSSNWSDSATGNFTLNVSNKIYNYTVSAGNLPFGWIQHPVAAHAGNSGIVLNISIQTNALISNLLDSWNMLSVPVQVTDNHKTSLFPSAVSNAFSYTPSGYQSQDFLNNGTGYWLKFSGAGQSVSMNGTYIAQETVSVFAGWNMIGSITDTARVSDILAIGTATTSSYFGYGVSGYVSSITIIPGHAYWVKVSQAGQLVLRPKSGTIVSRTKNPGESSTKREPDLRNFNELIVKDAAGNTRTLFFSPRSDLNLDKYELPPLPPAGIMDARFSTNRMLEAPEQGKEKTIPLLFTSAKYPITVAWKLKEKTTSAQLLLDGKNVAFSQDGIVHVSYPASRIELLLPSTSYDLPKEFALDQNYPNPFNPSTNFGFRIAKFGLVSLKVYNVLGEEIATLVNEEKQPGTYAVRWDANALPSGMYYYRLVAGEFNATKKLVLMK